MQKMRTLPFDRQDSVISPLNTIVIGDVGSGKTAVAFSVGFGFLGGVASGVVTLMAPTEVLAIQHYAALCAYKATLKAEYQEIVLVCVTHTTKLVDNIKVTQKILDTLYLSGKKLFILGTHSLLSQNIFPDLVMIDEQHRFGVLQRSFHQKQHSFTPHFISFTATPIPRTLSLTAYKHLNTLELERIASRKPITTRFIPLNSVAELQERLRYHIQKGGKAYVLVPAVEEGENEDEEMYTLKKAQQLVEKVVSLEETVITHGKAKNKSDQLYKFAHDPHCKVCIATSVVEVGIDVSEATLMIILNAERFGLATLHQLRGRIGRNQKDYNECIVSAPHATKRIAIITQYSDGFTIAEKDLELRGAGDVTGVQQSGMDTLTTMLSELSQSSRDEVVLAVEEAMSTITAYPRLQKYVEDQYSKTWKE